jgi:hypothetical protein
MSYELDLYRKLSTVRPSPLSMRPGFFHHGQPPNRQSYRYTCFDDVYHMVTAGLTYRNGRWTVAESYGPLSAVRVGDVASREWSRYGPPVMSLYEQQRTPYSRMTPHQKVADIERFRIQSRPLPDPAAFVRYYNLEDYVQVKDFGFYHLKTDVAKLGTLLFPVKELRIFFGVVDPPRFDPRPYVFEAWVGVDRMFPRSPVSLDTDVSFLLR